MKIADVMVQTDKDGCLKLIVDNTAYCHIHLDRGIRLGTLEDAERVDVMRGPCLQL